MTFPHHNSSCDRFVSLAFCWGEIGIETDRNFNINFAGGITEVLFGVSPEMMQGLNLMEFVGGPAKKVIQPLLNRAINSKQRIQDLYVSLERNDGRTQICQIAGYFSGSNAHDPEGKIFLSFKLTPNAKLEQVLNYNDGFRDADSFCDMANEAMERRKNTKISLISIPELQNLFSGMNRGEERNIRLAISSFLNANSLDQEKAGAMGVGKYVILQDESSNIDDVRDELTRLLKSVTNRENIEILTSSISSDDSLDPEDVAKGIVFAINQFKEMSGDDLTLTSLNANLYELAEEAVKIVSNFRHVVDGSKFNIVFQPIVSLQGGELHHYEVLSRFHGVHGESPYRYICFAEEAGLISGFDIAVINKAVNWLKENRETNPVSLAVNMSGQSLINEGYRNEVDRITKENPWLKDSLIIELTESSRIEDLQSADLYIQHLRAHGITVCLDDFGAGAASFNYLSAIAVDVVKIDGAAIKNTIGTMRGRAFMTAMAAFCKELKVDTIGEMIDDVRKLRFLQQCNIDYGQGYLFGKGELEPQLITEETKKMIRQKLK